MREPPCLFGVDCRLLLLQTRRIGYNHVLVDAQRYIAVYLDQQGRILHLLHHAVDTAGSDDLITLFQVVAELLHLLAALCLGTSHEEPHDEEHQTKHDQETVLLHEAGLRLNRYNLKEIHHIVSVFLVIT